MAESPKIAAYQPQICELEAGSHYWCACGHSKNGSFCDGSHKTTNLAPMKFSVQEEKSYFLCGCKKTNKKPFCDGSHSKS